MPVREETREILDYEGNPHTYYVRQKPPSISEPKLYEGLKIMGPALKMLATVKVEEGSIERGSVDKEVVLTAVGGAIQELFLNTEPQQLFAYLQGMLFQSTRDKERIDAATFDNFYANNMGEFYKACALVFEVNYGNFFGGWNLDKIMSKFKTENPKI